MTDVLAIAASARRGGNSDAVLEAALDAMRERGATVETIVPRRLEIKPCFSCDGCWDTGKCVVKDALQDMYPRFVQADHIVVAAPLYFTSLPGHCKVLIDRFQCFWVRTFRLKSPPEPRRRGMLLCVSAEENERYYKSTRTIIRSWMASLNMKCAVERFYPGVDAKDDLVTNHPEFLDDARQAAAELLDGKQGQ